MVKFIILTEIRTGYKWLASSLCSHPDAFCFGEIFGSTRGVRQASMFNMPIHCIIEKEDPVIWLQENIEQWGKKNKLQAVGFKLNYVDGIQLNGKYNKSRWDNLWHYVSSGEYKIIHLTRANLVDRALSELLADKDKIWANDDYDSKIRIEPNHLIKIIHRSERWQADARQRFEELFEITYEQMQFVPKSLTQLQQYLGLEAQTLTSNQKKQRKNQQSYYIENYDELSTMLKIYFPCYRNMLDHPEIKM